MTRSISFCLPGSVQECFEFGWKAFDLAEHLQTPVFVLSDLDLGMNQWMTKPFEYPDTPMDRGKVLWETDLEKLNGSGARYKDVDGDGIPYRTVPGNRHPSAAWFARGTGHDENARYTEDAGTWESNMMRLKKKYDTARTLVPKPVIQTTDKVRRSASSPLAPPKPRWKKPVTLLKQDWRSKDRFPAHAGPALHPGSLSISSRNMNVSISSKPTVMARLRQILSHDYARPGSQVPFRLLTATVCLLTASWVKETILAQEEK